MRTFCASFVLLTLLFTGCGGITISEKTSGAPPNGYVYDEKLTGTWGMLAGNRINLAHIYPDSNGCIVIFLRRPSTTAKLSIIEPAMEGAFT